MIPPQSEAIKTLIAIFSSFPAKTLEKLILSTEALKRENLRIKIDSESRITKTIPAAIISETAFNITPMIKTQIAIILIASKIRVGLILRCEYSIVDLRALFSRSFFSKGNIGNAIKGDNVAGIIVEYN